MDLVVTETGGVARAGLEVARDAAAVEEPLDALDGGRCCSRRISLLACARVRGYANVSPVRWASARRNASCLAVGSTASCGWHG